MPLKEQKVTAEVVEVNQNGLKPHCYSSGERGRCECGKFRPHPIHKEESVSTDYEYKPGVSNLVFATIGEIREIKQQINSINHCLNNLEDTVEALEGGKQPNKLRTVWALCSPNGS